MPLEPKKSRIILFFAIGIGLALLMAGLKALFAWIAHTYAYSVPWVGGFLKSIEVTEISNLLVFAILGAGVGAATLLLPTRWNHKAKLAFLVVLSPFVFSASYLMRQHLWIQQIATNGNLSYRQAKAVTNRYLEREVGQAGFFGFYPFSTQMAELPTQLEVLRSERSVDPNQQLTEELSTYDDPRADIAAYIFERVGWLIRYMYMTIAGLTAVIYYFKGALWADARKLASRNPASRNPAGRNLANQKSASQKSASQKSASQKATSQKSVVRKPATGASPMAVPKTSGRKPLIGKPSKTSIAKPTKPTQAPSIPHAPPPSPNQKSSGVVGLDKNGHRKGHQAGAAGELSDNP